jgi:AraC-like DNA-binding protein
MQLRFPAMPPGHLRRRIQRELVPAQPSASFTVRHFRQSHFPFNWHYHPEIELTLIVRGNGLRFVGDSVDNYARGDLCLLGSNLPHCWQSDPAAGGVHSIVIQFPPNLGAGGDARWAAGGNAEARAAGLLELAELRRLRQLLLEEARQGLLITGPRHTALARAMHQIARSPPGMEQLIMLLQLLNNIAEHAQRTPIATGTTSPPSAASGRKLGRVLSRLDQVRHGSLPTQREMARTLAMSPQAFSRFFHRQVGKTYVQYLNELRIGLVCRELIETDDPVTRIAWAAGYQDLSNFHRRFRALKGVTPREYRRRARGGER